MFNQGVIESLVDVYYSKILDLPSKRNKARTDISKLFIEKLKESNFTASISDIFKMDVELIRKLYQVVDVCLFHTSELDIKASLCISLHEIINPEERKYIFSNTFFTNMTVIKDFELAMSIFNFDAETLFYTKVLNIIRGNYVKLLIPSSDNTIAVDHKNDDILFYYVNLIVKIITQKTEAQLCFFEPSPGFLKLLFESINLIIGPDFYERINKFIELISNDDVFEKSFISGRTFSIYQELNDSSFSKDIFSTTNFINSLNIDPNDFSFLVNQHTEQLLFSSSLITLNRILDFGEDSTKLKDIFFQCENKDVYIQIIKYKHFNLRNNITTETTIIDDILNAYSFFLRMINVVEANNETIRWFYSLNVNDLSDIELKLKIIQIIRSENKPIEYNVFIEYIKAFEVIEKQEARFHIYHSDYQFENEGIYFNDKSDNYLWVRLARTFLYSRFINYKFSKFLTFSTQNSLLTENIRHNLIYRDVEIYDKMSIDVHQDNRDNITRQMFSLLLSNEEDEDDPFKELDQNIGIFTESQIEELIDDFFEYARVNLTFEESQNFFRVIGANYEKEPVKKDKRDFPGFIVEKHFLGDSNVGGNLILAHLWNFAKKNHIEIEMLNTSLSCIQSEEYIVGGNVVKNDYSICNPGKLQRFAISLLQGRLQKPDGSLFIIDDIEELSKRFNKKPENKFHPADSYQSMLGFINKISLTRPENSNQFFKLMFEYIIENNLQTNIYGIVESLCIYAETSSGFVVKPELSISNLFDGMFNTEDYLIITNQLNEIRNGGNFNQDIIDNTIHFHEEIYESDNSESGDAGEGVEGVDIADSREDEDDEDTFTGTSTSYKYTYEDSPDIKSPAYQYTDGVFTPSVEITESSLTPIERLRQHIAMTDRNRFGSALRSFRIAFRDPNFVFDSKRTSPNLRIDKNLSQNDIVKSSLLEEDF